MIKINFFDNALIINNKLEKLKFYFLFLFQYFNLIIIKLLAFDKQRQYDSQSVGVGANLSVVLVLAFWSNVFEWNILKAYFDFDKIKNVLKMCWLTRPLFLFSLWIWLRPPNLTKHLLLLLLLYYLLLSTISSLSWWGGSLNNDDI